MTIKKRLFQSFRRKGRNDEHLRKMSRVVLLDARTHQPADEDEAVFVKPTHSIKPAPTTTKAFSNKIATQSPAGKPLETRSSESANEKPRVVYVKCPLGVEEGNYVTVISPDGTQTFDAKVPKGIQCGQEFPVTLPPIKTEEEWSVFNVLGNCITPTHSQDGDEENFETAIDSFFTPVPEVKAYDRAQTAH